MLNKKKFQGQMLCFQVFNLPGSAAFSFSDPETAKADELSFFVSDVCRKAATTAIKIERAKIEEEVTTHLLLH